MEYYGELVICLCEEMKEKEANDYEIMDGYMCFDKEERMRICWSDKVLGFHKHPCSHLSHRHLPPGLCSRGFPGSMRRYRIYDGALWGCEEMLLDRSLIRAGLPPGWSVA
ncbi:hypothetical protein Tco_0408821 [Tanacetum coccineum]